MLEHLRIALLFQQHMHPRTNAPLRFAKIPLEICKRRTIWFEEAGNFHAETLTQSMEFKQCFIEQMFIKADLFSAKQFKW